MTSPTGAALAKEVNVAHNLRTQGRLARWPAASNSMKPQPHFLTICWDATAEDGTPVTLQATLCKTHRQMIALRSASARGVRRQFGESCDMCHGREPRTLGAEPRAEPGTPKES